MPFREWHDAKSLASDIMQDRRMAVMIEVGRFFKSEGGDLHPSWKGRILFFGLTEDIGEF
jgi:hypothetical protein